MEKKSTRKPRAPKKETVKPAVFRSGFVALVGRPNVGKSTILNYFVGQKISIVSSVPQTTRHQIKGILNIPDGQIVFVDTPGIHSFKDPLADQLNTIAKQSTEGCDLILYVVDVTRNVGKEEEDIVSFLVRQHVPVIMALNKIDLKQEFLSSYVEYWKQKLQDFGVQKDPLLYFLPLSAREGTNMADLKKLLIESLSEGPAFYDTSTATDFPLKFRVADAIREKLFCTLAAELPHSLAVEVAEMQDKGKIYFIKGIIYVNRISQKKIVIGTKGALLKEIGTQARYQIEKIIGKKVYLELWVEIMEDWQNKPRILQELGYWLT